ncbi:hypothetical protein IPM62_04840 [Candidatus Woesebacteria bacterium]|nr:MAG: hypothetical protein IPM62_04840 [Candidatus Woesebacteria bacterium]
MAVTSSTILSTKYGNFMVNYHKFSKGYCISLTYGDIKETNILVRIQSSCLFSEAFHAIDCDCNLQLSTSLKTISKVGSGVVVYSYEEGRGVGLENKIRAMELERTKGIDTVEAFEELSFSTDPRTHSNAIRALTDLGISNQIRLITNNPNLIRAVSKSGFVVNRYDIKYPISERIKKYLRVKKEKLGYLISDDMVR